MKRVSVFVLIFIFLFSCYAYSSSGVNSIPFESGTTIKAGPTDGWKIIGPGGGGAIFHPTVSPHDPNTALVACDMTGTYITHDAGKSWKEINLRQAASAIAFDPVNPKTIYASSTGLFRSDDGGDNWQLIYPNPKSGVTEHMIGDHADHHFSSGDNWPGGRIQFIEVDPTQSNRIYLGIRSDMLYIYYSTNRGETWKKACSFYNDSVMELYIDPSSPEDDRNMYVFTESNLYKVSTKTFKAKKFEYPMSIMGVKDISCGLSPVFRKPVFYLTTSTKWDGKKLRSGVMRSLDQGRTWHQLRIGLDSDLAGIPKGQTRDFRGIETCENDARRVYVTVERIPELTGENRDKMNYQGIFVSKDLGTTWEWSLKVGDKQPQNKLGGWYERSYDTDWVGAPKHLGVSPKNPDVIYYTGIGMAFNSYDGGKVWKQAYGENQEDGSSASTNLEVTTTYGVHFDPFDKDHMVISYTDIGMQQSNNGGKSWSHAIKGVPNAWKNTAYWMVFDPEVEGRAWSVWASAHDLPREKMFRRDLSQYVGGVCKSDDGIKSWTKSNTGMPENTVATHIVLDPKSPAGQRTLYVAAVGKGVYKSTDDGKTWTLKNKGISGNLNAWRFVLTPDGTLYLLVIRGGGVDGAMYKSTDGAESWQKVALPKGVNAPNDMVLDPEDPDKLYMATWPKTVNGQEQNGGLYASENGGQSWTNIFDQTSHVYSVAVDTFDPSTLFIVTFEGAAYRSDDKGQSWSKLKGYDFKWGHRPVIDPYNEDMLYITTFGSSVWYGPKGN